MGASDALIVAIITASTLGERTAFSTESVKSHPLLWLARRDARSRFTSQAIVTGPGGKLFRRFWPTRPQPMRATRGVVSVDLVAKWECEQRSGIPFLASSFAHY